MQLINDTLAGLALAAPQNYANLAVYPLIAPPAAVGASSAVNQPLDVANQPDYLVLDEALQRKLARVTEVSEGGSVPELAFENFADLGVLLLDGEELVGARQNRVLNITVLVGAHQKITIPVSCVEHGRWRYNSDEFASAGRALFSRARADKARHVSASLRQDGSRRSDQGEVWDRVAEKSVKFCVRSETGSMADVYEQEKARLDQYVDAVRPAPGQCGAVFAIDGRVAGLELFDSPGTFARYLPKIVRSYAMDAAETPGSGAVPPAEAAVRRFIEETKAAATDSFKALGAGEDVRIEGGSIAGGALVHAERVVHLAAFMVGGRGPRSGRKARAPRDRAGTGDAK